MTQRGHHTRDQLRQLTRDELRELARGAGVKGFGSMRKTELVRALCDPQAPSNEATTVPAPDVPAGRELSSAALFAASASRSGWRQRRLSTGDDVDGDSLLLEALDSRWMRAAWVLSSRTLERVVAAMGVDWHLATPILRLYRVSCDEAGPRAKTTVQDFTLPADVRQWFISTPSPGGTWTAELGYLTKPGKFYPLMHSLPVELPETARAHSRKVDTREDENLSRSRDEDGRISVRLNVELAIRGATVPGSRVLIDEDAVDVEQDGTFQCFVSAPDGRLVLPIEVTAPLGRQRVLMAFERNTRFLEAEPVDDE